MIAVLASDAAFARVTLACVADLAGDAVSALSCLTGDAAHAPNTYLAASALAGHTHLAVVAVLAGSTLATVAELASKTRGAGAALHSVAKLARVAALTEHATGGLKIVPCHYFNLAIAHLFLEVKYPIWLASQHIINSAIGQCALLADDDLATRIA